MQPEPVSGKGNVWSWTITRHRLSPGMEPPYVIALVELVEQPCLRLITAVVGDGDTANIAIGMPVSVAFERTGDIYIPIFVP